MVHKPIKLIVLCIAVITLIAMLGGIFLLYADRKGGELVLSIASGGVGGLIALLSSTRPEQGLINPVPVPVAVDTAKGPVEVHPVEQKT